MEQGLEFDDVLIKPIESYVTSRDDVDISVKLSDNLTLNFPLIASPMVGVVDGKFASALSQLGGIAIFHRFYTSRESLFKEIDTWMYGDDNFGISIKIGEDNFEEYIQKTSPNIILIDTANGYNQNLLRYCEKVKAYISKQRDLDVLLMAGNVVDYGGCLSLARAGCDLIRIGIGGGSPCSTRNQTGIGVPNITALDRCWTGINNNDEFKLVIDGGIKNSGDFVKAVVAGADLGLSGRLFAETFEAPNDGVLYGMASRTHMENTKAEIKSVEGFDTQITKKHSLADFVREFGYGIKSAGTYLNARSLNEIFLNGEFIQVTNHAIKKGI